MLFDECMFACYTLFWSCRLAVGHALSYEGGDAYDYMDGVINILSCFNRNCFLVQKQVTSNEKAAR